MFEGRQLEDTEQFELRGEDLKKADLISNLILKDLKTEFETIGKIIKSFDDRLTALEEARKNDFRISDDDQISSSSDSTQPHIMVKQETTIINDNSGDESFTHM